jgi:hypothetical protein
MGTAEGSIQGERFSCTGTSTAEFTRGLVQGEGASRVRKHDALRSSRSPVLPSLPDLAFFW